MASFGINKDLERGACYPGKKARRLGHGFRIRRIWSCGFWGRGFCVSWSRICREIWVADFA
jgi:hypothetical protein